MNRKKLLIPGGNPSELQLINAAHRLGLYVITSGNNKTAPAHQFADKYVCADFSDKEALIKVAEDNHVDYICSNSNDIALISTTYVCDKLNLPGHDSYETTLRLHHKDSFKELAKQLSLHVPEGESFFDRNDAIQYAESLNYKVIIKPVDLVGGNGVSTAETHEEKIAAIDKAFSDSINKKIVIERYVEGSAHSLSTYIVDKKVAVYFSDNEYTFGKPFKISTSASPATGFDLVRDILIKDVEKVSEALNLIDGRVHVQYLMEDGHPYILEISRRLSGDLYSVPESYSLGFNIADWKLRSECGMDISSIPRVKQQGYYGRHCITAPRKGITNGIILDEKLDECVIQKWLWGAYNYTIQDPLNDIIGLLFFKFDNEKQEEEIINSINQLVTVNFIE